VIDLAHEGHQGISQTKQLLREKVWFPTIDKQVEEKVSCCLVCQFTTNTSNIEPLCMPEASKNPWESVSIDFCSPFPSGEYLLVLINNYSRYPEVDIIRTVAHTTVIPCLDKIFATHGIPRTVKSDNGPI
jgi:hypothetical protein